MYRNSTNVILRWFSGSHPNSGAEATKKGNQCSVHLFLWN